MITPLAARRGLITPLARGIRRESAAVSWWLSGGIDAANCIAAYQPKGAADYATSKVNLANPGTYNAAEGTAPDWDSTNGWKFDGVDDYLDTGYYSSSYQYHSMIVRISNYGSSANSLVITCGDLYSDTRGFCIVAKNIDSKAAFYNGHIVTGAYYSNNYGVYAVTNYGYLNGVKANVNPINYFPYTEQNLKVGGYYNAHRATWYFTAEYIQALAIYNTTITAEQVSALTTAMNAL